ncbi:hypothetical protein HY633_02855 [Candidatus Uhrbacteria bacterium]|nr:hypothetical protein [Candidatus Uhrbacteria bacterium]
MRLRNIMLVAAAGIISGVVLSFALPRALPPPRRPVRQVPELVVVPIDGPAMDAPRTIADPNAVSAALMLDDRLLGDVAVWVEGEDLWIRWTNATNIIMVGGHVCIRSEPFRESRWQTPEQCPYRLEQISSIMDYHELAIPLVVCCHRPGPVYIRAHAMLMVSMRDRVALYVTLVYRP